MEPQGVTVIGVSVDRDAAALEKFVANAQLNFPIARDPQQTVSSRYGTFKFPESYIIDLDGRIAEKLIGAVNWQDERIVNLVSGLAHARKSP
jgi:peroxiredoxin